MQLPPLTVQPVVDIRLMDYRATADTRAGPAYLIPIKTGVEVDGPEGVAPTLQGTVLVNRTATAFPKDAVVILFFFEAYPSESI